MTFIAEIDSQADITIYLKESSIFDVKSQTIDGILVKSEKPKKQGTISLSIDDKRKTENGLEIGINDAKYWGIFEGFHLDIYLGNDAYNEIMERGKIGIRQRMRSGSKITIYDMSKNQGMEQNRLEDLEFYIMNKDKLPDYLG